MSMETLCSQKHQQCFRVYLHGDEMVLLLQVVNSLKPFLNLSHLYLPPSARQTGSARPADTSKCRRQGCQQRVVIGGRKDHCLTHEKADIFIQETAFTLPRLDQPVPPCHRLSILLSFAFLLHFALLPLVILTSHVDFFIHLIICVLSFPPLTPASSHLSFPLFPGPLPSSRQP